MQHRNWILSLAAIACLIASPFSISAQQPTANGGQQVIAIATERPLAELLPDKLAGVKATSDVKQYNADNLAELVGDEATIYREYYVTRAASRQYGAVRIDVFESSHPFGAFGLETYYGSMLNHPSAKGAGESTWRGKYFVRVITPNEGASASFRRALGMPDAPSISKPVRAVLEKLPNTKPGERPVIMRSLPESSRALDEPAYYLGPESLNVVVPGARDLYAFNGDAEAVVAEYQINKPATDANNQAAKPATKRPAAAPPAEPMKLLIVEYHTPQFAYDAINRANDYVNALPENEQQRVIIKREGNYIVQAVNFDDRNAAQAIVDAVQYPYGVQWLHHPSIPSPDPFRGQKAAQMLLSTFGLLGLLIGSVILCGSIFGTTMFLKRRKRMQEVFSDAGDMLRLDIDPFEEALLGLPPKRE
jgi:hypothetical protein